MQPRRLALRSDRRRGGAVHRQPAGDVVRRPVALQLVVERLGVDAEDARRARLVAAGRSEHAHDVALLDFGERKLQRFLIAGAGEQLAQRRRRLDEHEVLFGAFDAAAKIIDRIAGGGHATPAGGRVEQRSRLGITGGENEQTLADCHGVVVCEALRTGRLAG